MRVAKWALVVTAAASFGTAATVLARTGAPGTPTTTPSASVTPAGQDDQADQGNDDFFGGGSIAPPSDFGSSPSSPPVRTHTS